MIHYQEKMKHHHHRPPILSTFLIYSPKFSNETHHLRNVMFPKQNLNWYIHIKKTQLKVSKRFSSRLKNEYKLLLSDGTTVGWDSSFVPHSHNNTIWKVRFTQFIHIQIFTEDVTYSHLLGKASAKKLQNIHTNRVETARTDKLS